MKKIIYLFFASVVMLSCTEKKTGPGTNEETGKGILVKVSEVKSQGVDFILNYSGTAEPVLTVPLSFQLLGTVEKIYVDEGDQVKKGQLLAEIDKSSYQSSYNAALAMQQQAGDAYERFEKVYRKGSLPEIKWEEVKSKLEQANSTAKIAKKNLENCSITSPINGVIGKRTIENGENTTPGISVFDVISTDHIYVRISVPEDEINKINKGQVARVTFPALGEKVFEAVTEKVGVEANRISRTYEVKLRIKNDDREIKPGMACNIDLPLDEDPAILLLPAKAVMKDERGTNYVFVVSKQVQEAKRINIQTDGIINNQLAVSSGVAPGDLLIVEGQHKLSDGMKIRLN